MKDHIAYISGGSNIGNGLLNCKNGIAALTESGACILKNQSRFYKTEPVDYKDQEWFVNFAVKIETALNPFQLLNKLKLIERDAGRTYNSVKFGPRILDLDIIMYDDIIINSSVLIVPHPRMHKRRFVLKPVCDIDQKIVHPVLKKNMKQLLDKLLDKLDDKKQEMVRCQ